MIFITGASGDVGNIVLQTAVSQNLKVRAGSRTPQSAMQNSPLKSVEWLHFDFNDPSTFPTALVGVEKVFLYRGENSELLVDEAKKAGVQLIVFMSSLFVTSPSPNYPGQVHGAIETKIRGSGIPFVFVRGGEYMKNELRLAKMVKTGHVSAVYPKSRGFYVHERDVAEVAFAALTRPELVGTSLALTGPKYSVEDIIAIIERKLGRRIEITGSGSG